jgi:hypothetical protein
MDGYSKYKRTTAFYSVVSRIFRLHARTFETWHEKLPMVSTFIRLKKFKSEEPAEIFKTIGVSFLNMHIRPYQLSMLESFLWSPGGLPLVWGQPQAQL